MASRRWDSCSAKFPTQRTQTTKLVCCHLSRKYENMKCAHILKVYFTSDWHGCDVCISRPRGSAASSISDTLCFSLYFYLVMISLSPSHRKGEKLLSFIKKYEIVIYEVETQPPRPARVQLFLLIIMSLYWSWEEERIVVVVVFFFFLVWKQLLLPSWLEKALASNRKKRVVDTRLSMLTPRV